MCIACTANCHLNNKGWQIITSHWRRSVKKYNLFVFFFSPNKHIDVQDKEKQKNLEEEAFKKG
jgi:hypothetical protein